MIHDQMQALDAAISCDYRALCIALLATCAIFTITIIMLVLDKRKNNG